MNHKQLATKINELEADDWKYAMDSSTWTGGYWWHEEKGFVTNGGGYYSDIVSATCAVIRFQQAMDMIT